MKFDVRTLDILKNFYTINPSIKFTEGNILRTVTPKSKSIFAKARIKDTIERDFCIGELNRFMAAMSIFNDPDIILEDTHCIIKGEANQILYRYEAEITITVPPVGEIVMPPPDVQFTLTNEMFQTIRRAMAILSVSEMVVYGKDGEIGIKACNPKGVGDHYKLKIGETDKTFEAVFKGEHLKLLPLDYDVSITSKGFSWFNNPEVEYWIVIDGLTSKFE